MLSIRTQKVLPVFAVLRGEHPAGQIVFHDDPFEGSRTWSYVRINNQEEMAAILTEPTLRGFRDCDHVGRSWEEVQVQYHASDIVEKHTPRNVLLITPSTYEASLYRQDQIWGVSSKNHGFNTHYPIPDDMPTLRYDYPVITPGQFDIVVLDYRNSEVFDKTGLREYAEDALRPGGVLKIIAPHTTISSWTRQLATRFERCTVNTEKTWVDRGEHHQVIGDTITFFGVKKAVRKYDLTEEKLILSFIDKELESEKVGTKQYVRRATPLNRGTYPPSETVSLKVEKTFNDEPLMTAETLTVKVAPRKDFDIKDFKHISHDEVKKFGQAKLAWGSRYGGYDIDMTDPKLLPELRKLIEEKDWELHIKGQKAITTVTLETITHEPFQAAEGLKPQLLPKFINKDFADEWLCNSAPLPEDEVVTDEKQLVFPVAPSLANLMKLFGQLKPAVIQGKDGIYYLASGTVTTEVLTDNIVDDKGREVTVENTKKRAKLVTFALTGNDPGQQYEAEMG